MRKVAGHSAGFMRVTAMRAESSSTAGTPPAGKVACTSNFSAPRLHANGEEETGDASQTSHRQQRQNHPPRGLPQPHEHESQADPSTPAAQERAGKKYPRSTGPAPCWAGGKAPDPESPHRVDSQRTEGKKGSQNEAPNAQEQCHSAHYWRARAQPGRGLAVQCARRGGGFNQHHDLGMQGVRKPPSPCEQGCADDDHQIDVGPPLGARALHPDF